MIPVNDRPVAVADNGYEVTEDQVLDTALLIGAPPPNPSVLTNDLDVDCVFPATDCNPTLAGINPIVPWPVGSFGVGAWAANGSLEIRANGTFVYTPRANFFGTDTFQYWVYDGSLYSLAPAAVRITVLNNPNDFPNANDDVFTTSEDVPILMAVSWTTDLDRRVVDIPVAVTVTDPPDHGVGSRPGDQRCVHPAGHPDHVHARARTGTTSSGAGLTRWTTRCVTPIWSATRRP